jgi:hypothetical protein
MHNSKERDAFARARLDAMLSAHAAGLTSNEDLENAAYEAEKRQIERVGVKSERRFDRFCRESEMLVVRVRKGTPLEDVYDATDRWIVLAERYGLPELPVQIKSSFRGVREFKKNNNGYSKLAGLVIVVNSGPSISLGNLRTQINDEAKRIQHLLRKYPDLVKLTRKDR